MPPAAKHNCIIVLYDVKCDNREKSLSFLTDFATVTHLSKKRHQVKLILFNTAAKNNHFKYDHVYEVESTIFQPAEVNRLIKDYENDDGICGNWDQALHFAAKSMQKYSDRKGVVTFQLVFISDFSHSKVADSNNIKEVINVLNNGDVFLYVSGLDVRHQNLLSIRDIENSMRNLSLSNQPELAKIVQKTRHTVVGNYGDVFHLVRSYCNRSSRQPWKVPLTFGSIMRLNCESIRGLERAPMLKVKRIRNPTSFEWVDASNEHVTFDFSQVLSGLSFHGKFVEANEKCMFHVNAKRSFCVLGVVDSHQIPEHVLLTEGTYFVQSSNKNDSLMVALVTCLEGANQYILAKRVYNANSTPKFVVLIPRITGESHHFLMVEVPYAEDVLQDAVEEDLKSVGDVQTSEEFDRYCRRIDLESDDCQVKVSLAPTLMVDDSSIKIMAMIKKKLKIGDTNNQVCLSDSVMIDSKLQAEMKAAHPERTEIKTEGDQDDEDSDLENF